MREDKGEGDPLLGAVAPHRALGQLDPQICSRHLEKPGRQNCSTGCQDHMLGEGCPPGSYPHKSHASYMILSLYRWDTDGGELARQGVTKTES